MLSDARIERYSRQILLASVGGRGQEALLAARVVIVGDGTVARTAALYLAAAGVGHIELPSVDSTGGSHAGASEAVNPDSTVVCGSAPSPASQRRPDLVLDASAGDAEAAGQPGTRGVRRLGARAGNGGAVVVDLGRTCHMCARGVWPALLPLTQPAPAVEGVAAAVAGSLLAQEALGTLLQPDRPGGRCIRIDVGDAAASTESLALPACPHHETFAS